jgi:steroid 5-alpha reductase family enzyme
MSYWIVLLVSLLACSVGFHMYIWFFSVGYGLAIAAIGVALAVGFHGHMSLPEWLACILLFVYGLRLGGYLLMREMKNAAYRKVLNPELERSRRMPIFAKIALWVTCGVLYTLMTIPLYFRLKNGVPADAMLWIGLAVMTCGVALEAVADLQKTAAKKKNSRRFVDTGLYRVVRCPNYLGELLLWLGMLLTGTTALRGPWQWIPALLGFILIVWVMFSGARRLELRQDKNYGADPEYQKYVRTVPILIPFIPLYSVKKYKFLVA